MVFGAMASPTLEISSGDVIFKQVVVKGFWGSKVFPAMDRQKRAALMGELVSGIGSGALTLPVERSTASTRSPTPRAPAPSRVVAGRSCCDPDPAAAGDQRTTMTGHVARCRTSWLTDPSSRPLK